MLGKSIRNLFRDPDVVLSFPLQHEHRDYDALPYCLTGRSLNTVYPAPPNVLSTFICNQSLQEHPKTKL